MVIMAHFHTYRALRRRVKESAAAHGSGETAGSRHRDPNATAPPPPRPPSHNLTPPRGGKVNGRAGPCLPLRLEGLRNRQRTPSPRPRGNADDAPAQTLKKFQIYIYINPIKAFSERRGIDSEICEELAALNFQCGNAPLLGSPREEVETEVRLGAVMMVQAWGEGRQSLIFYFGSLQVESASNGGESFKPTHRFVRRWPRAASIHFSFRRFSLSDDTLGRGGG